MKRWEKVSYANGNKKRARKAIFISHKINFKPKTVTRDKGQRRSSYNNKEVIHQEDIIVLNIFAPNIGTPKYMKQKLTDLKGEIHSNTVVVGALISHFQWIDHSDKKLIRKHRAYTDINRTFHPKTT